MAGYKQYGMTPLQEEAYLEMRGGKVLTAGLAQFLIGTRWLSGLVARMRERGVEIRVVQTFDPSKPAGRRYGYGYTLGAPADLSGRLDKAEAEFLDRYRRKHA